jgi:hypothetical protein
VANAKRGGIIIKPVMLDPDKFIAFCRAKKMKLNGPARSKFAVERHPYRRVHHLYRGATPATLEAG